MSVSKFGNSSDKSPTSSFDKKYVDQKFMTLSTNLAVKVEKSGDTLTGDLYLSCENDHERSFGVKGISEGKSVGLLLGDFAHQIHYNFGHPLQFSAIHGYKFTSSCGDVCKLGGSDSTNSLFFGNIVMSDKCITELRNPNAEQDAATKYYVDTRGIKNNVGYVPNLTSNSNKNGFIVSASSEYFEAGAYNVFNDNEHSNWITADGVNTNFWIQIKCPERVKIYKIKLRGLKLRGSGIATDKISFNWIWQGSNDGTDWININEFDNSIGYEICEIPVNCSAKYSHYRIFVNKAETDNPGFSYWQLYPICPVFKNKITENTKN